MQNYFARDGDDLRLRGLRPKLGLVQEEHGLQNHKLRRRKSEVGGRKQTEFTINVHVLHRLGHAGAIWSAIPTEMSLAVHNEGNWRKTLSIVI